MMDTPSVLNDQIPAAPVDMVMPPVNTTVAIANGCLLLVVAFLVIREARATRSAIPVFILLGAALASLLEPIFDIVGAVWYPEHGSVAYMRAFNVSIPLWLIPAYAWYIGGLGNFMYRRMRGPLTMRQVFGWYFVFWLANFVLEMPGLNLDIYRYYGAQPFRLLGFPLWMAMTNALMPLLIGATFNRLRAVLRGASSVLMILIVPMVVGAAQIGAGWPVWLALNDGATLLQVDGAALVSLGLASTILYVIGVVWST